MGRDTVMFYSTVWREGGDNLIALVECREFKRIVAHQSLDRGGVYHVVPLVNQQTIAV